MIDMDVHRNFALKTLKTVISVKKTKRKITTTKSLFY